MFSLVLANIVIVHSATSFRNDLKIRASMALILICLVAAVSTVRCGNVRGAPISASFHCEPLYTRAFARQYRARPRELLRGKSPLEPWPHHVCLI